jgi:hypothetical protein
MCLSLGYVWQRYVTYKVLTLPINIPSQSLANANPGISEQGSFKFFTLLTDSQCSRVSSPSVFLQTWQTLPHGKPTLRHYTSSISDLYQVYLRVYALTAKALFPLGWYYFPPYKGFFFFFWRPWGFNEALCCGRSPLFFSYLVPNL